MGHNTGAVYVSSASSAGNTGGSTLIDRTLEDSDDYIKGKWVVFTSGTNDGDIRAIADFDGPTKSVTLRSPATGQVASAVTYELWDHDMPPARVHDFINRAIRAVPRKAAPPSTIYNFHTGGQIRSFDIPTALVGIQKVSYRAASKNLSVLICEAAFDESVTASVTATLDDEDKKTGAGSCRLQVAAAVGTGLLASDSISSSDLSGYTHIEFWVKSSVATAAGDLVLRLSSTANAASGTDDISVPALTAATWTYCRVALANPWLDTAIISIGLRMAVDIGASYIWLNDIKVVREDAEEWRVLSRGQYRVNRDERELILTDDALDHVGYTLLMVEGVKKPTELSADGTSCDIEPEYIICKTTALLLRASGDRKGMTREAAHQEADRWEALAQAALGKIQTPQGVVWVDDA